MTDKQPPRTAILPSDIDAQGNVTLWDHGPQEVKTFATDTPEQAKAREEQNAVAVKAWQDKNGDMAQPLTMHSSDAMQAMATEPGRYALEPADVDEAEVEKRVKEIKDKRQAAADFPQNVADRKTAISGIMSERRAAATLAKVEPTPEPRASRTTPVPESPFVDPRPALPPDPVYPPPSSPEVKP
jgi:hypothetical protein